MTTNAQERTPGACNQQKAFGLNAKQNVFLFIEKNVSPNCLMISLSCYEAKFPC